MYNLHVPLTQANARIPIPMSAPAPVTTEMQMASAYRIGRYTAAERRLRIERYRQKRSRRNFNNKVLYACRKRIADRRTRVHGRFVKQESAEGDNSKHADTSRPFSISISPVSEAPEAHERDDSRVSRDATQALQPLGMQSEEVGAVELDLSDQFLNISEDDERYKV